MAVGQYGRASTATECFLFKYDTNLLFLFAFQSFHFDHSWSHVTISTLLLTLILLDYKSETKCRKENTTNFISSFIVVILNVFCFISFIIFQPFFYYALNMFVKTPHRVSSNSDSETLIFCYICRTILDF
jgi:dolichyl-phosphate-mannose--protein O-mannosyl transferase